MSEIKEIIRENLENNFIDNMKSVEKEMNMLNILLDSFTDNFYTYDECCKVRMKSEIEACDYVDSDYKEMDITDQEKLIIQNNAVRKTMGNPDSVFDKILEEEYVKWQLDKFYKIDKKVYSEISYISSIKLLREKTPLDVWLQEEEFLKDICKDKGDKVGEEIAKSKIAEHEEQIRSSMI